MSPIMTDDTPTRRVDRTALYNALMRACFKAEILASKCAQVGITGTGLDRAARDFSAAAERVKEKEGRRW